MIAGPNFWDSTVITFFSLLISKLRLSFVSKYGYDAIALFFPHILLYWSFSKVPYCAISKGHAVFFLLWCSKNTFFILTVFIGAVPLFILCLNALFLASISLRPPSWKTQSALIDRLSQAWGDYPPCFPFSSACVFATTAMLGALLIYTWHCVSQTQTSIGQTALVH